MKMRITAVFLVLIVVACPFWASGFNLTGKWVSSAMGAKLKAHITQKGDKINGVAFIYPLFGKKMTYHFSGTINGVDVFAAHHQGHSFRGKLTPRGTLEGVVYTRQGHKLAVSARRR